MSVSGVKLLCITTLGSDPGTNNPVYRTEYRCTLPVEVPSGGLHYNGEILTPLDDLTESTFNLQVQQAIANYANVQTSDVEAFVANDVFGGRV